MCLCLFDEHLSFSGGMHGSRDVCFEGKESPCNTRRFRDGSGEGDEEGDREKHVLTEAVEMIMFYLLCFVHFGQNGTRKPDLYSDNVSNISATGFLPGWYHISYAFLTRVSFKFASRGFKFMKNLVCFAEFL